jgi:hypothetical protein
MSGVTPLVDTLLATRLGQRVDLVPLKAQLEIPGPGAVESVQKVDNDVRLPSREALQRQLGPGLVGRDGAALDFTQGGAGGSVTLSAAARTVSALLRLPVGTPPTIRGLASLLPDIRTPAVPVLAATLARTVAESGLFYESHLQHFATGQRTLAQLAREPQAALASLAARAPSPDTGVHLPAASADIPFAALPGVAPDAALAPDAPETADRSKLPAPLAAGRADADPGKLPASPLTLPPGPPESVSTATTYGRTGLPDHEAPASHDFSLLDGGTPGSDAASAGSAHVGHSAASIHPEAVGLVRQQLEMLAVPVFRWSGEGWPGIPMDWEIRQEREEAREQAGREDVAETAPSAWTTRMTLKLPRLGTVDVRLGLAGAALQLRLTAAQDSTVALLNQARAELPRRLVAVGLELADLQIGRTGRKTGAAPTGNTHVG